MTKYGRLTASVLVGAMPFAASGEANHEAQRVTDEEVAKAFASKPTADDSGVRNRLGSNLMSAWVSDGKVPGKVLFEDMFADGSFEKNWIDSYAQKGMITVGDDGRGGMCLVIPPRFKDFNCIELKKDAYIPVELARPTAILWETRAPQGGNTPMIRIDFYDGNKKIVCGEYQFRTNVDPTQPTLFQRNAHLVTAKMPSQTKFLRMTFHHCPKESDEFPGEIANVRVVDLGDDVAKLLEAEVPVREERAAASEKIVLVYTADNLTSSFPVMPVGNAVPGRAGDTLKVRECAGEKTRTTAILWSKTAYKDITVRFSDLKKGIFGLGGTIPASALSAKVVKVHFQAEGAPSGFVALSDHQVLVPELFLNDDKLVIPDNEKNRNLIKYQRDGKTWYADINSVCDMPWNYKLPAAQMPITDAKTLQPFDMRAEENKQLMIRFAVPESAVPGNYTGEVVVISAGEKIAELPIELEVLPFTLPKTAETIYNTSREFTMGLYVWATPSGGDKAFISPIVRSREQCLNEWKTLVDYGITDPTFIWFNGIVFDDAKFREYLALAREAGFPGKILHLGASGHIGNDTDPEKLKKKQVELKHAVEVAKEFGFDEVFFYGFDEAKGERLLSQIPAWKAAHEVGAKIMVSGYSQHFKLVGDYLDLCLYADNAGSANPADWHSKGGRIWKYNTPQTGPEDPGIFRRNYGLEIWKRGFDGGNTYCDVGASTCWNDICGVQRLKKAGKSGSCYRGMCIMYLTTDGVIETLPLSGLESAIKDIRIMTKFRQLLRAHPDPKAEAWFASLKPEVDDLVRIRRETIDWILKLSNR